MNSYRLNIPYPTVSVDSKNLEYAQILNCLYAGPYGELSGLSTYMYQAVITEKKDKRLSDIIDCISLTELKHFRILAGLIHMLGADPLLYSTNNKGKMIWWNGQNVSYNNDINSMLMNNINEEIYGISAYKKACSQIKDNRIKAVLERIILDEEYHVKIFKELLK